MSPGIHCSSPPPLKEVFFFSLFFLSRFFLFPNVSPLKHYYSNRFLVRVFSAANCVVTLQAISHPSNPAALPPSPISGLQIDFKVLFLSPALLPTLSPEAHAKCAGKTCQNAMMSLNNRLRANQYYISHCCHPCKNARFVAFFGC